MHQIDRCKIISFCVLIVSINRVFVKRQVVMNNPREKQSMTRLSIFLSPFILLLQYGYYSGMKENTSYAMHSFFCLYILDEEVASKRKLRLGVIRRCNKVLFQISKQSINVTWMFVNVS